MAMEARRRTIRIVLVVMVMVFGAECLLPVRQVLVYIAWLNPRACSLESVVTLTFLVKTSLPL